MSYDNPATHGLFEELLAGATAVKERPQLIAERDSALSEVEFHKLRVKDTQIKFDEANTRAAELEDKLRGMEDAYQAATFRETEVRAKLETLVTSFKNVIGEVKAAADLANELVEEPKPVVSEPDGIDNSVVAKPVGVQPDPTAAVDGQEATASTPTADAAPVNTDSGVTEVSVSPDPTQGCETSLTQGTSQSMSATTPQENGPEADLPGKFPWKRTPTIGDVEDASMHGYTPEGNQYYGPGGVYHQAKEAAVASEVNPIPAATVERQPVMEVVSSTCGDTSTNALPKPYWEKPSSTTWFDWRALGNDIAPWCKNASDESLRNLFN